jgi:tetratricopeptide (TPR) repeat protein
MILKSFIVLIISAIWLNIFSCNCLGNDKQPERAAEDMRQYKNAKPGSANDYFEQGCRYILAKRYDRALKEFDKAIAYGAHSFDVYYNRARTYFELGQIICWNVLR